MRTIDNIRRFRLSDTFVDPYRDAEVPWGPLGYITYKRTYSRRLNEFDSEAEGTEEWWQTCRRVVEGMFNMHTCCTVAESQALAVERAMITSLGRRWNTLIPPTSYNLCRKHIFTLMKL